MQYINSWQKNLNAKLSITLTALCIFFFMFYQYILFSRLAAEGALEGAKKNLGKLGHIDREMASEKVRIYRKALRLLGQAIRLNPLDAKPYFEYAQTAMRIAGDTEINLLLDINSLGENTRKEGNLGFYDFARVKYMEAINREPANALYHHGLGVTYNKLSDKRNAEKEFGQALLLDPQNLSLYLYLCQYFLAQNEQDRFNYYFQKTVELYKRALMRGGDIDIMARNFFKSIGREDLIF